MKRRLLLFRIRVGLAFRRLFGRDDPKTILQDGLEARLRRALTKLHCAVGYDLADAEAVAAEYARLACPDSGSGEREG